MKRRNIHFRSLRSFEAVARNLSLSKAADELCVTHAAVSHQLKLLEELLDVKLYEREGRGIRLTDAGLSLFPTLRHAFDLIENSISSLSPKSGERTLKVTASPAFAARWLIPRLPMFRAAYPSLEITLIPTLRVVELIKDDVDVGIRCGVPPWEGVSSDFLLPIHMTPVCSPALLDTLPLIKRPADIAKTTLIHADIRGRTLGEEWQIWFAAAGVSGVDSAKGLSLRDPGLALQAAIEGLGMAIGYKEFYESELHSAKLVEPVDITVRHNWSFHLVYAANHKRDKRVAAFRDWIIGEAKREQKGTDNLA